MPLFPPLAILAVVAALLAVRRVRGRTLPAWAVTLAGALIVIESTGRMGATVRTRAFTGIGLALVVVQGLCYWSWLTLVG